MPRRHIALGLIFGFACQDYTQLSTACEDPCYTGDPATIGKGICLAGRWRCENLKLVECIGEVLPALDLCDGIDQACTGTADSKADTEDPALGFLCGAPAVGQCRQGHLSCVGGKVTCAGAVLPQQERCVPSPSPSDWDWDCDGIPNNIKAEVCYDGDPTDLTHPKALCKSGVTTCIDGHVICRGQILPQPEVCGSGVDANCNGIVDDVQVVTDPVDVVVLVNEESTAIGPLLWDWSNALASLGETYASDLFRYSIVRIGRALTSQLVLLRMSPASTFVLAAKALTLVDGNGEPVSHIVADVAEDPELLGLRDKSVAKRLMILFVDDDDDYFREIVGDTAPETALGAAQAAGFTILIFAPVSETYYKLWADGTGGALYPSNLRPEEIVKKIGHFLAKDTCP